MDEPEEIIIDLDVEEPIKIQLIKQIRFGDTSIVKNNFSRFELKIPNTTDQPMDGLMFDSFEVVENWFKMYPKFRA